MLIGGFKACRKLIRHARSHRVSLSYEKRYQRVIEARQFCQILANMIISDPMSPKFNIFDVTKDCVKPPLCYDFSHADTFFNDPEVKRVLGT